MSVRYKVNGSFVTIPTGGKGGNGNVWEGTSAEFELEKDTIEDDTVILINDDIAPALESYPANKVTYDNTESKAEATNLQDAVDDLNNNLTYKKLGEVEVKKNATFTIPSNAKELCFVSKDNWEFIANAPILDGYINTPIVGRISTSGTFYTYSGYIIGSIDSNGLVTIETFTFNDAATLIERTHTLTVYYK